MIPDAVQDSRDIKIGLISDTHGCFDAKLPALFAGVERILHAGDIGSGTVLDELRAIAPVTAVMGNVDDALRGRRYRHVERVTLAGRLFLLTHRIRPRDPDPAWREMIFNGPKPDLVVFGHTHEPERIVVDGVTFFNPGSAGPKRAGHPRSAGLAIITSAGAIETQWLDLGL